MKSVISILDALRDPALFAPNFPLPTWRPWLCCAAALFGLTDQLTEPEQAFARECLGGRPLPTTPVSEAWLIIGRRGGKSRFAAVLAIFLACFRDYRSILAPGERGVVMIIAADRRQAGVVHRYVSALLHAVPMLEALIANETKESIELTNRIVVEVHTASFRSIRGRTVVGAICDEVAFWRSEDSANPDTEILNALRPSTATVPGSMVLAISSPYARRGELWRAFRNHYGQAHDRVVVWTRRCLDGAPDQVPAIGRSGGRRRSDGDGRHASVAWRWCADADRPTRFKPASPSPTDAVRDGSAKLGHPVQNVTREHGLTPLPR